ncbi:phosphoglycerate kinase [Aurantibacillus circumpalustris]|uniref:phosphoglycerate kinase n=1 Tax=Aurantibacillus circumpalustris TaxID=3036359 RepID=UPI00295AEC98|nr:phosphoglycerate kinase [Aurantibacillus circumpalustris]
MKTVDSINFSNKRAVVRVDFNVPLNDKFEVTDATRIQAAIPTLKKILKDGGSIVLMSHLGRPKDGPTNKYSLKHIVNEVNKQLGVLVQFADDCISDAAFAKSSALKPGEVLLLENLRFYKEEEKGDAVFAKKLSQHGNIYVNDAFGTAHRAHASTAIMANNFDAASKCFGYVMANEIASIDKVLNKTQKPFTAIIGGAKVSDKIMIIEQLMSKADNIIIGGGMAFTFIKALGGKIGNSLCEDDRLEVAKELLAKAKVNGVNLCIPMDAVIADSFSNDANTQEVSIDKIPDGWMGLDIGKKSIEYFGEVIKKSKTILWNGPMGVFEMSKFENGTKQAAFDIVAATKSGAYSLIGGGDSVAAINKYHLADQVSYVSTGGGALLEYIEQGTLPGVRAIEG